MFHHRWVNLANKIMLQSDFTMAMPQPTDQDIWWIRNIFQTRNTHAPNGPNKRSSKTYLSNSGTLFHWQLIQITVHQAVDINLKFDPWILQALCRWFTRYRNRSAIALKKKKSTSLHVLTTDCIDKKQIVQQPDNTEWETNIQDWIKPPAFL